MSKDHDIHVPRIHYGKGCCFDVPEQLHELGRAIAKRRRFYVYAHGRMVGPYFKHVVDKRYPRKSIYFIWHGPGSGAIR